MGFGKIEEGRLLVGPVYYPEISFKKNKELSKSNFSTDSEPKKTTF